MLPSPKVHVGDMPIKRVKETKALEVYIDEYLSWNKHIELIFRKKSHPASGRSGN